MLRCSGTFPTNTMPTTKMQGTKTTASSRQCKPRCRNLLLQRRQPLLPLQLEGQLASRTCTHRPTGISVISLLELVTVTKVTDLSRRLVHHTSKQAVEAALVAALEEELSGVSQCGHQHLFKPLRFLWVGQPRTALDSGTVETSSFCQACASSCRVLCDQELDCERQSLYR
jgi:hypothetical protein